MIKSLWVMRHGLAVDYFESDFSRALSAEGERQVETVIEQLLNDSPLLPKHMLSSPLSRTVSTAKIVQKKLGFSQTIETENLLIHSADHKLLADFLLTTNYEQLLIVSHMPIVSYLCQYLAPGCELYSFETAQCIRMDFFTDSNNIRVGKVNKIYLPVD